MEALVHFNNSQDFVHLDSVKGDIVLCGGQDQSAQSSCVKLLKLQGGNFAWEEFATTDAIRSRHSSWVSSNGLVLLGSSKKQNEYAELVTADGTQKIFDLETPHNKIL